MQSPYVLVIDDEPNIRQLVKEILEDEGLEVAVAQDGASARAALRERRPDLVLLDIWMPDIDGISLFKECFTAPGSAPVIVMSGHATVETAVEATRLGAYAFLEKPLSINKLLPVVEEALTAARKNGGSARVGADERPVIEPVGKSRRMQQLRDQLRTLAAFSAPALLTGEVGTGKSVAARYLHSLSPRRTGPYVAVELNTLPRDALASLLFGSEYQGVVEPGYVEQAAGGTLYLADLAELAPDIQLRLISLVTLGNFVRQGGADNLHADVRLVFASTRDLAALRQAGSLREDFYALLRPAEIAMPALRDHREDVPDLIKYFVDTLVQDEQLGYRHFTLPVQNRLRQHDWPGNVSSLENLVRQLLVLGTGAEVTIEEVEPLLKAVPAVSEAPCLESMFAMPLREAREVFERLYLEHQLARADGSMGKVAKLAGVERTYLYRKLRALSIDAKQLK